MNDMVDADVVAVESLLAPIHEGQEIAVMDDTAPAVRETDGALVAPGGEPGSEAAMLMGIIASAASNPAMNVDTMRELMAMHRQATADAAERAFNQAMTRLASKMPTVQKNGVIAFEDKKGNLQRRSHARYEDIDDAIRPHLIEEGMLITFTTKYGNDGLTVFGTLAHKDGHSRTAEMRLPVDASGAKNPLQGMGSSLSYGKRYLVCMLLNIITVGQDDDGTAGGTKFVTEEQTLELQSTALAAEREESRFLEMYTTEAKSWEEVKEADFVRLMRLLTSAKRQVEQRKAKERAPA